LITAFTTDTLPNQAASERLETILESTSSILPPGNFTGNFGESGFMTELQDGYLYDQYWGGSTDQVGHFLTAVNGGYNVAQGQLSQDVTLRFFLGHEKIGDQNGPWQQYGAASDADIDLFLLAVGADAAGNYDLRDEYLMRILGSGSLAGRTGNSLEDLRLTLRGWRFGQMIANGKIKTREDAAIWLQENIGQ
jgi:hypothetical protein